MLKCNFNAKGQSHKKNYLLLKLKSIQTSCQGSAGNVSLESKSNVKYHKKSRFPKKDPHSEGRLQACE